MAIAHLLTLEKDIEQGLEHFACLGRNSKEWLISREYRSLAHIAQQLANRRMLPITIFRLLQKNSPANKGCPYLVPTYIEVVTDITLIEWSLVESSKEAEAIRDLKFGPTPYFAAKAVEQMTPQK